MTKYYQHVLSLQKESQLFLVMSQITSYSVGFSTQQTGIVTYNFHCPSRVIYFVVFCKLLQYLHMYRTKQVLLQTQRWSLLQLPSKQRALFCFQLLAKKHKFRFHVLAMVILYLFLQQTSHMLTRTVLQRGIKDVEKGFPYPKDRGRTYLETLLIY